MLKPALIFLVLALLSISVAEASSVYRTFSKTVALPNENIIVNLTVSITGGETFYAIDESYPSGWTLMSTTGDTNQSGHIKWAVIQGAASTNHSYMIRTPSQGGTYGFSGLYLFEGMVNEASVSGQTQVTVQSSDATPPSITFTPPTPSNNTDVLTNYIYVNALISEDLGTCTLNWYNGSWQNVSMTRDPGLRSCYRNITGLANYTYQFRVYATDAAGNLNVSGTRQSTVRYSSPPGPYCGDGSCTGETCSSCSQDCGACPPSQPPAGGGGGGGGGYVPPAQNLSQNPSNHTAPPVQYRVCIPGSTRECSLYHKGICSAGTETCLNESWVGCPEPVNETYNGLDDDCDTTIDEGTVEPENIPQCPDGMIPLSGCKCGGIFYTKGYCYSDTYHEGQIDTGMIILIFGLLISSMIVIIKFSRRRPKP